MRPALPALFLYAAITLPLAFLLNVWQDDAYTLHTTHDGLKYAFDQAVTFESNAPLYFVVLTLWRHINETAVWARLFSVLCGAGTVAITPALVRRYLPELPSVPATLAMALNPFLIWAALEIRVYALVILLAAVLLLLFFDGFLKERANVRARAAYFAVSLVCAYTQYYLLFLVAAQGALLLVQRSRALRWYILGECAVLVLFVPMVSITLTQMREFKGGLTPPTLFQSFQWLTEILAMYVLPLNKWPMGHVLYVIAVLLIAVALFFARRFTTRDGEGSTLFMLACSYVLFAGMLYVAKERMFTRHPASLLVLAMLAVFALFTWLREPLRRRAFVGYVAVLACIEVGALLATYHHLAKPGDWIRVSSFISAREAPHQPILVFEAENALPFDFYYHGKNRVIPVPRGVNFRTFDQRDFVVHGPSDMTQAIRRGGTARGIWLVTSGDCNAANIQFGCEVVQRYVDERYRVVTRRTFYGTTVRLLEPRAQSSAAAQTNVRTRL